MNDMTMVYILLGALAIGAFLVHAKKKAKRGVGPLANKSGWYIEYSEGLPERPQAEGAGWVIDIPMQGQGFLGSVKQYTVPKLRVGGTLTLVCRVEGNGAVAREFPDKQATATVIVQRRGDNGQMVEHRWYSGEMVPLVDGEHTIVVPLTATSMGGVMGSHDPNAFKEAIDDPWNMQIGFGSAGGRAHSVHATSPTRFHLVSLTYKDPT